MENKWIFETVDYKGTPVVLSRDTWHTKAGNDKEGTHPEIRDYLEDVKTTVEAPDLVSRSTRYERSCIFYKLRIGCGVFAGKHLVVVVKYVKETTGLKGYVSTMYISRNVYSKGVQLWPGKKIQTK